MLDCFKNFIGVDQACNEEGEVPISGLYITSLEGITVKNMAKTSSDTVNEIKFIEDKLEFAVKEYAEYVLSFFDETEPDCAASCNYEEATYSALENKDLGITYKLTMSSLQKMSFTCLRVRVLQAGDITIKVTDGDQTVEKTFTVIQGDQTVDFPFSTRYSMLSIYANGTNFQLGQIECGVKVGCRSCSDSSGFSITGYEDGKNASKAYGFIPDICVECDEERVKCTMIQQSKQGALYYAGVKLLDELQATDRLNYFTIGSADWVEFKKIEWAELAAHFTKSKLKSIGGYLRRVDANCYKCQGTTFGWQKP